MKNLDLRLAATHVALAAVPPHFTDDFVYTRNVNVKPARRLESNPEVEAKAALKRDRKAKRRMELQAKGAYRQW